MIGAIRLLVLLGMPLVAVWLDLSGRKPVLGAVGCFLAGAGWMVACEWERLK